MAVVATKDFVGRGNNFMLALCTLVFSGNYTTGGESLDFVTVVGMLTTKQPKRALIKGKAGFTYDYDLANKKVMVRDASTVTIVGGQAAGSALQILPDSNAGVLGKTVATTRTIPASTFGLSAPAELPAAAYPAGVTGDVVEAWVFFG